MDAFYASVEQRDNPSLAGKPVVVGGSAKSRGVVAAASYEARKFGVYSAMPAAIALRRCPDAIFVPSRIDYYGAISKQINEIFHRFTPLVEPLALDEAFLDVAGSTALLGSPAQIGRQIKDSIRSELKLTASIGIAPNKFLAKLASDLGKPDGFESVSEPVRDFLDPLPVSRLWGVGAKAEKCLMNAGIRTFKDFRTSAPEKLAPCVGSAVGKLQNLARGIDNRAVVASTTPKSISTETTFETDTSDLDYLQGILLNQVQEVASRVRLKRLYARQVGIKVRYANFQTITRAESFSEPTDLTRDFWDSASNTLCRTFIQEGRRPVRLIGVRASAFSSTPGGQPDMFESAGRSRQQKLDRLVDQINTKYGKGSLHRGATPSKPH